MLSEEYLLSLARLGFSGQEKFNNEVVKNKYKLYIIDNVGGRESYSKIESPLWEQLIEHIYSKDLAVIFTSAHSAASFAEKLPGTSRSRLSYLVSENIISMRGKNNIPELQDWTPEEQERQKEEIDSLLSFNVFE